MFNLLFLVIVTIMLTPVIIFHNKVSKIDILTIPIIIFESIYLNSAIWASAWITGTIITLVFGHPFC